MRIDFGREICGDPIKSEEYEWLVTNGIGGYASGTISGMLTRRYHGLLVGALKPPLERSLLLSKLDETAKYGEHHYPLHTNRWVDGIVEPSGYQNIESFALEGTIPKWSFACADAILQKRIWMQHGQNTTYIQYALERGSSPMTLSIRALVNYRDYHGNTIGDNWQMQVDRIEKGVCIRAFPTATPFYLLSDRANFTLAHDWYKGFDLAIERERGLSDREDHLQVVTFDVKLEVGETFTIVASIESGASLDGKFALQTECDRETKLLENWHSFYSLNYSSKISTQLAPDWIKHLVLAADQFIVDRRELDNGKTIIAGYHWFSDWGRDTMISLSGLTLATGRPEIARSILFTFAQFLDRGMLPNRFPDVGEQPEYNTVDATLWYFEAIRAYHAATGDDQLLHQLFPALAEVIDWHCQGTRYNIHLDSDGLLYAGESGVQLTWMDAKIGDWVVTPRIGKPVEINALWYCALVTMTAIAKKVGKPHDRYEKLADQARTGFQQFWNPSTGYCYDVLNADGTSGHDDTLRPNQILAVSLPITPLLTEVQQKSIVDACGRSLLTSYGLRSLSPDHLDYCGHYGGDSYQRDSVYHQGTVWGWLLGAFVRSHLRVYQNPEQAHAMLQPMSHHLQASGLGSLSEIFDGDAPMRSRGCIAQAWTVAEVLQTWIFIEQNR
jgi:predicted glycogen debranching enzyme